MFKIYSLTVLLLICCLTYGQGYRGTDGKIDPSKIPAIGKLSIKIVDGRTSKPLEFATVTLKSLVDSTFITGGIADAQGNVDIEGIKLGRLVMKVSFIGFQDFTDTIKLRPPTIELNYGTVKIRQSDKVLKEITITGEKADIEIGIDKKVFNVDKNPIIQGGSTLDALKQVPTISVDQDNNISMRGSTNVQIFINGKPSGMNSSNRGNILDQLPASTIQSVEIISNPSAKFDAEGMSGIINIVTKQNQEESKNGSVTAGIGTRGKYNASVNYNYRKGKWTFGNSLSGRIGNNYVNGYNYRDNLYSNPSKDNSLYTNSYGSRQNYNVTLNGNMEYRIDKKQSIGLNYLGSYAIKKNPEDVYYRKLDSAKNESSAFTRQNSTEGYNENIDAGLSYSNYIIKDKKELTASVNYSYSNDVGNGYFYQFNTLGRQFPWDTLPLKQHNNNKGIFRVITSQVDYMFKPITDLKIETGAKSTLRHSDNTQYFDNYNYGDAQFIIDRTKTNQFIYNEYISAAYVNGAYNYKKFGIQTGLRAEQTHREGTLVNFPDKSFKNDYLKLFPSIFLKYSFKNKNDVQASYTRRINRPGAETLNPFAEYDDPYNIRKGNPYVLPELVDAYELTYTKYWESHTLVVTGYFRQINNNIQRIRQVDTNNISTVTNINLNYAQNIGLEIIGRTKITKWWNITGNINFFKNVINGQLANNDNSAATLSYFARANSNMKIPKIIDFSASINYTGPNIFPSGKMKEMWALDLGFRHDFSKRFSVNLSAQDIFNSRRFRIVSGDYNYVGQLYRKRESQIFMLNLTWKFGNNYSNQDQEKNQRRKQEDQGGDQGGGI